MDSLFPHRQLSLDSLRAFISVIELQSYTAAGQLLGRSQPAISLQLQRLEEQLGKTLLNRKQGRIELTPAGSELLETARQMLLLNDRLLARFDEQRLSGRVRLGIPSEYASTLMPQLLGRFSHSYPDVALSVTSALSRDLLAHGAEDKFDLVVALQERGTERKSKNDTAMTNLAALKEEPLVWVGRDQLTLPLRLVAAPAGCIYRKRALERLRAAQQPVTISYTDADFSGLTAAIKSGLGITVLTQSTVPADLQKLQHPQLPDLGSVHVVLELRATDNTAAESLASYLKDYLQG